MMKNKNTFKLSDGFYIPEKVFIYLGSCNDKRQTYIGFSAKKPTDKLFSISSNGVSKKNKNEIENVLKDGYSVQIINDKPFVLNDEHFFKISYDNFKLIIQECGISAKGVLNGKYLYGWKDNNFWLIPESIASQSRRCVAIKEEECKENCIYADADNISTEKRFFCMGERVDLDFVVEKTNFNHPPHTLSVAINPRTHKCFYGFYANILKPFYEPSYFTPRSGMMAEMPLKNESYKEISKSVFKMNAEGLNALPTDISLDDLRMSFRIEPILSIFDCMSSSEPKDVKIWVFNNGKNMLIKKSKNCSNVYIVISIVGNHIIMTKDCNNMGVLDGYDDVVCMESNNQWLYCRMRLNLGEREVTFADIELGNILRNFFEKSY